MFKCKTWVSDTSDLNLDPITQNENYTAVPSV